MAAVLKPPPKIYAELLPNIRQVSLAVELCSPCENSTSARVSANGTGSTVWVSHGGATHSLVLPGRVRTSSGRGPISDDTAGDAALPISPAQIGATQLAWRLPLDTATSRLEDARTVPWSALHLPVGVAVSCRTCDNGGERGSVLVAAGRVAAWKDLPDQGWAEMMEFWHCHKPKVPVGEKGQVTETALAASRGYGANAKISAQVGVGLVDLTLLLFAEQDCTGITYSASSFEDGATTRIELASRSSKDEEPPPKRLNLFCGTCRTKLGYYDFETAAVTCFKWKVNVANARGLSHVPARGPDVSECLAAELTAATARSGSSKSVLMPILNPSAATNETPEVLHLWTLNSSIRYSTLSSRNQVATAVPAIKLLYRAITRQEAENMVQNPVGNVQDVDLPPEAIAEAQHVLDESNQLLPGGEKYYQGWKVGLLRCWEEVRQAASSEHAVSGTDV